MATLLAFISAFLLLAAISKAAPPVWQFIRACARVPFILDAVAQEFSPNGGGSMKDAITRLEDQVLALHERLGNLEERQEPI